MNVLWVLGIYYEYYYVILLIVLFSNFVLFKKIIYFYLIKIIFGIKELKIYNEKLCICLFDVLYIIIWF